MNFCATPGIDQWLGELLNDPRGAGFAKRLLLQDGFLDVWWVMVGHVFSLMYARVMANIAMEHGHLNSGFSHERWWFSTAMVDYQRVTWLYNLIIVSGCKIPVCSMVLEKLYTNIGPKNHPNVGKYTIRGTYGIGCFTGRLILAGVPVNIVNIDVPGGLFGSWSSWIKTMRNSWLMFRGFEQNPIVIPWHFMTPISL